MLITDVGFYLENTTHPKANETVHASSSLQETTLSKMHLSLQQNYIVTNFEEKRAAEDETVR